jgi:ATP-binding cassette subfamily B protein
MTTDNEEEKKERKVSWSEIMRFSWHYWRPNKWLGAASCALMLGAVSVDSAVPVYMGRIVDAMTKHAPGDAAALKAALAAFGVFAALAFANQGLRIGSMYFWNAFAVRSLHAIVTDLMQKVQRFSSDWHANSFAGGTVRKITRCMWSFDMFEDTWLMGILPALTIMAATMVMLAFRLPLIGLGAGAMIVVYCAASIWLSIKVLAPRFRESAECDTKMGATLADIITGNPTVKAFGAEKREDEHFLTVAGAWKAKAMWSWQTSVSADAFRSAFRLFMMTSMIAATIFLWKEGSASPGDIVLVMTTFFILGGYLRDIGMHISHLQRAASDMEDGVAFWLRQDDVTDAANAASLTVKSSRRRDMISFDKVGFKYPNTEAFIYRDMSIDIGAGEKLALVGPSGSGKSTFVKLIQRLYNVTEGQIRIDGQDIAGVTMESLRKQVALVPQDPILFHRSLSDNLAYGNPGVTQEQIVAAAKKSFAHDFIMALPKGYDTLVGERGVKLSGGERQRVAIARAILADAPILILDEATSSLDSISEHYIQKALEELMKGRTTITIAHRLSTIQKADRILVFDQGAIIEQGDHASLMARPHSRYKALYDMQALELVPDYKEDEAEDQKPRLTVVD